MEQCYVPALFHVITLFIIWSAAVIGWELWPSLRNTLQLLELSSAQKISSCHHPFSHHRYFGLVILTGMYIIPVHHKNMYIIKKQQDPLVEALLHNPH